MLEISTCVAHNLGRVSALKRIHQMVDSLTERFPQQVHQVSSVWDNNRLNIRFAAYGYLVQWEAVVREDDVSLKGQIPDAARVFKCKIEQAIVARLETVLEEPTVDADYRTRAA
jgi:Putative polyhydroxyalkanoic acid system protein (PHA_gran_rgn)